MPRIPAAGAADVIQIRAWQDSCATRLSYPSLHTSCSGASTRCMPRSRLRALAKPRSWSTSFRLRTWTQRRSRRAWRPKRPRRPGRPSRSLCRRSNRASSPRRRSNRTSSLRQRGNRTTGLRSASRPRLHRPSARLPIRHQRWRRQRGIPGNHCPRAAGSTRRSVLLSSPRMRLTRPRRWPIFRSRRLRR